MGTNHLIQLKNVTKKFGKVEVLRGVDLDVCESEAVVLIGSSGSGKSTILRCMNLLEEPTSGEVIFAGVNLILERQRLSAIRRQIGMVFQSFNLYPHMTALGNVSLALRKVVRMRRTDAENTARQALEMVGLGDMGSRYPSELSGGQQQRVGIARALALKPKAVLFDEPTSALDPELVSEVLDVMVKLREQGMTMVIVTHELGFARRIADSVAFIDKGTILEVGAPGQLFTRPTHERTKQFIEAHLH